MKLHTLLYDFIDIIGRVPEMKGIKLTPIPNGLQFFGISTETSSAGKFVLEGETIEPVNEVSKQFGIHDLAQIKKIFKAPGFDRLTARADIHEIPHSSDFTKLVLSNQDGASYKLSLYGEDLSNKLIENVHLIEQLTYQICSKPSKDSVDIIKYWNKISRENGGEKFGLMPITRDGKLFFNTTTGSIDDVEYVIDHNANGILKKLKRYNSDTLSRLISLTEETKETTLQFSDAGLCRIDIETSCAKYTFYVPANVD
jgi:hypothetical protein